MLENHRIAMMRLREPLAKRLAAFKAGSRTVGGYVWTVPAKRTRSNGGRGFYQHGAGLFMDTEGSSLDLRLSMANDFISTRLAYVSGYACDEHGDGDSLKPIVARLSKRRGFLAGWTMGAGMAACLDGRVFETADDAAHAAHQMAEADAIEEAEEASRARQVEELESLSAALSVGYEWGTTPGGFC